MVYDGKLPSPAQVGLDFLFFFAWTIRTCLNIFIMKCFFHSLINEAGNATSRAAVSCEIPYGGNLGRKL